jgi:DNA uptake protein ComE-like DNA-binding protein
MHGMMRVVHPFPSGHRALARRIIAGRPYGSVEDLDAVPGIGPALMAKLRGLVTAE